MGSRRSLVAPLQDALTDDHVEKPAVALADGSSYAGQWKNGDSDGKGVQMWSDGRLKLTD